MRTVYGPMSPSMGRCMHIPKFQEYPKNTGDGSMTEVDELRKNYRAAQEENFKLQAVITDVTEVNKRWQKYNNDRQMYVQRLLSTIQDQQEQMNKIVGTRAFPSLQQATTTEDHKNVEALNARLKEDLAALQNKLEQLEKEHREHVEVLEFQVKAHRDDWEAERSEKQQALQDKAALELRVKELQKDVRTLKVKLKEERGHKQYPHCVHCYRAHMCEAGNCNVMTIGNPKTYRTSVHLPCASGHMLSRGTTLYFGDHLVSDGDNANAEDLHKHDLLRSRSCSVDDSPPLSPYEDALDVLPHKDEDSGRLVHKDEMVEVTTKALGLNIAPDEYRCSVVHISPAGSGSNIAAGDVPMDSSASGVTIGFSSGGLASVTSFSQRPVVKSSSLPVSERFNFDCETSSQWSLDSGRSSVVGPPSTGNYDKEKKTLSGNLTKSEGNVTGSNVRKASVPWKTKYYEEGVETQTKTDVVCLGCDQVFPPSLHLKFLDHFEVCQKNAKKSGSAVSNCKIK